MRMFISDINIFILVANGTPRAVQCSMIGNRLCNKMVYSFVI